MTAFGGNEAGVAYCVVANDEEQFSVWRADSTPPRGWRVVGPAGDLEACLEYIREQWTDMRPLSLRQALAEGHA